MATEADIAAIFETRQIGPAIIVEGAGIKLRVERGQLIIEDGFGPYRRTTKLSRADRDITRIIVPARDGYIGLDAIQWCADVGKTLLIIDTAKDTKGDLLLSGIVGQTDARVRRIQATRPIEIPRAIMTRKLLAQYEACGDPALKECVVEVENAESIDEIPKIEAKAGRRYWRTYSGTPIKFEDSVSIPENWLIFQRRSSQISGVRKDGGFISARRAQDPMNAMLNLSYSVAKYEAKLTCLAIGLDPTMGIVHKDTPGMYGMALDLVEPARPHVDTVIREIVATRTFSKMDFVEDNQGQCIVCPPLTHEIIRKVAEVSRPVLTETGKGIKQIINKMINARMKRKGPQVRT